MNAIDCGARIDYADSISELESATESLKGALDSMNLYCVLAEDCLVRIRDEAEEADDGNWREKMSLIKALVDGVKSKCGRGMRK